MLCYVINEPNEISVTSFECYYGYRYSIVRCLERSLKKANPDEVNNILCRFLLNNTNTL